jgi:hypothetical protein
LIRQAGMLSMLDAFIHFQDICHYHEKGWGWIGLRTT